jgi:hypothetical protein
MKYLGSKSVVLLLVLVTSMVMSTVEDTILSSRVSQLSHQRNKEDGRNFSMKVLLELAVTNGKVCALRCETKH